jgi:hypothetical protein
MEFITQQMLYHIELNCVAWSSTSLKLGEKKFIDKNLMIK